VLRRGWSLNIQDWRELAVLLTGTKWNSVPFDETARVLVPQKPGVYMIVAKSPVIRLDHFNSLRTPLYIGRSKSSLRTRFSQHIKIPQERVRSIHEFCPLIAVQFLFTLVSRSEVCTLESLLIDCYGPSANIIRGKARLGTPIPAG